MKKLKFAFVAFSKNPEKFLSDPSFIYRCENLALALRAKGHTANMLHYTQFSSDIHYDLVYFHRPKRRFGLTFLLRRLRKAGTLTIADFDDLVFDPGWAHCSPGVLNDMVSLRQTVQNFRSHYTALKKFDQLVVSTQPLADKLLQVHPEASIIQIPNTVHFSWYNAIPKTNKSAFKYLTYFPGTRSHDRDFAQIRAPLEQILDEHPNICLNITGVLDYEINCRPQQLQQFEKQKFNKYHQYVSQSWVNLAPLENTEFNQHKSAIKAIEAAFWHVPTVATPIPDMLRLADCGALLAYDNKEWYQQLKLLCDDAFYQQQTSNLRERILATARIERQADLLARLARSR